MSKYQKGKYIKNGKTQMKKIQNIKSIQKEECKTPLKNRLKEQKKNGKTLKVEMEEKH